MTDAPFINHGNSYSFTLQPTPKKTKDKKKEMTKLSHSKSGRVYYVKHLSPYDYTMNIGNKLIKPPKSSCKQEN
jgi:hypothetical protein